MKGVDDEKVVSFVDGSWYYLDSQRSHTDFSQWRT
jgi:hypothetical protein